MSPFSFLIQDFYTVYVTSRKSLNLITLEDLRLNLWIPYPISETTIHTATVSPDHVSVSHRLFPKLVKSRPGNERRDRSHRRSCRDVSRDCYDEWSERFRRSLVPASMPLSLIDELRTRVVNEYERDEGGGHAPARVNGTLERNVEIFTKSDADRGVFSMSLMSVKGEITLGFWSLLRCLLMASKLVDCSWWSC